MASKPAGVELAKVESRHDSDDDDEPKEAEKEIIADKELSSIKKAMRTMSMAEKLLQFEAEDPWPRIEKLRLVPKPERKRWRDSFFQYKRKWADIIAELPKKEVEVKHVAEVEEEKKELAPGVELDEDELKRMEEERIQKEKDDKIASEKALADKLALEKKNSHKYGMDKTGMTLMFRRLGFNPTEGQLYQWSSDNDGIFSFESAMTQIQDFITLKVDAELKPDGFSDALFEAFKVFATDNEDGNVQGDVIAKAFRTMHPQNSQITDADVEDFLEYASGSQNKISYFDFVQQMVVYFNESVRDTKEQYKARQLEKQLRREKRRDKRFAKKKARLEQGITDEPDEQDSQTSEDSDYDD